MEKSQTRPRLGLFTVGDLEKLPAAMKARKLRADNYMSLMDRYPQSLEFYEVPRGLTSRGYLAGAVHRQELSNGSVK